MLTSAQARHVNELIRSIGSTQEYGPQPDLQTGYHRHCIANTVIWTNRHTSLELAARLAFHHNPKTWGRITLPFFIRRPDQTRILHDYYGLTDADVARITELEYTPLPSYPELGRELWVERLTNYLSNLAKPIVHANPGIATQHLDAYHVVIDADSRDQAQQEQHHEAVTA